MLSGHDSLQDCGYVQSEVEFERDVSQAESNPARPGFDDVLALERLVFCTRSIAGGTITDERREDEIPLDEVGRIVI